MICIFHGEDPTGAYLVRDWLLDNGIPCQVRGANLLGAIGQVPVREAYPSVWVHRTDRDRAKHAIQVLDGPKLVHPTWKCACGETIDPPFASCWSCGRDR